MRGIGRLSFFVVALALLSGCEQPQTYPDDPHAALKVGWTQLGSAEYDRAIEAFQHALKHAAPNSRDALLARFGLASTEQSRKPTPNYDEAARLFQELATADKGGEIGAWSALAIVRMQHLKLYEVGHGGTKSTLPTTAELDSVRDGYKGVIALFPGRDAADEAAMFIGASYIEQVETEQIDKGVAYLQQWIGSHNSGPYLTHAYGLLASAFEIEARGNPEKWNAVLTALMASVKNNEHARDDELSAAYYRIARIAELKTKQPEIAKEYYWKLKKMFPTDQRIFYCNRALLELGEKVDDIPVDPLDAVPAPAAGKPTLPESDKEGAK